MSLGLLRSWRPILVAFTGASFLLACTVGEATTKKKKRPVDYGDEFYDDEIPSIEQPLDPDNVNTNSGAFGAGERPAPDAGPRPDAGIVKPEPDAGALPKTYCGPTLVAGDLAIVEIMITSRTGSGDSGEWVELQNTRDCWLKLQGVAVESPRGTAAANVATITDDYELAPHGTFVVADSADPAKNHAIGGKVVSWEATDVLKNDGDTLTVKIGTIQIDTLTYPAFNNLVPGRTLSFPGDCAWSERSNWARWSLTFNEFSPGFKGTPNAANSDIACF